MKSIDETRELFARYDNVMRTEELTENKIYYRNIQILLADGIIEKLKQGYYSLVDDSDTSEVNIIKRLFPDAILCMHTALFYHGYSGRTPSEWHLAVDKNISRYKIKIEYPFVKTYLLEPHILSVGLSEKVIDGKQMHIYDKDRTICDCLRYMGKMDKEIFNKAIQCYVNDPKKNVPNLMQYAKELRVQKKVKDLIGVWL